MNDEFNALLKQFEGDRDVPSDAEEKKLPILLIDDDESIRRALSRALSGKYNVLTAESGMKGVELLSEEIHCVILDVKMRDMNGFAAYPKLKEKCPEVLIIFYTAFQSEHDLQDVINKFKPEGYVQKGKDISFLQNLLENAVRKHQLIQENEARRKDLEKKIVEINEANALLKEQREHEKRLERTMTGGFAHEMRNALTGATLEISSIFQDSGGSSAAKELQEEASNILEFILTMENQFDIPKDTIDQDVIPHVSELNETIKLIEKTLYNVRQDLGRGLGITNQILNYSKLHDIERGSSPIDLAALMTGLKYTFEKRVSDSGIFFSVDLEKESLVITGDKVQLESIFRNLVLNAIEAVEEMDAKEIGIALTEVEIEGASYVKVTVQDSGPGIPEDHAKHLFDPFFTRKYSSGTGLGLSIAKRMAELYQGKIAVESEMGAGAKFTVHLKLE